MNQSNLDYGTNENLKAEAFEKLYRIELNQTRKQSLIVGIFLGLLITGILLSGLGFFLWFNQDVIAERVLNHIVSSYMEDLFATFPDAYVSNNQHKILPVLDAFTNAAAKGKVSDHEFKEIGKGLIRALKDKQLTYHEIDDLLVSMRMASEGGNSFD